MLQRLAKQALGIARSQSVRVNPGRFQPLALPLNGFALAIEGSPAQIIDEA